MDREHLHGAHGFAYADGFAVCAFREGRKG